MIPSVCVGCYPGQSTASIWAPASYSDPSFYNFSRKTQPISLSDIFHFQNSLSGIQHAEIKNSSHMTLSQNSALGPLQAFCTTKNVQNYVSSNKTDSESDCSSNQNGQNSKSLKFGINRILSEEFGKTNSEKENIEKQTKATPHRKDDSICECGSRVCPVTFYNKCSYPSPVLSAVHAIQPPQYPLSAHGMDSLPGPYSILNDDGSVCNQSKRKRSWSRAVFSNLQRKGLEKRFEVQKYVTKPDRRQLAAMLGLTDAQVKVWFQNRRMKWRHAQQSKDKDPSEQKENTESEEHCEEIPINMDGDNDSHLSEDEP